MNYIIVNGKIIPSETACISPYDRGFTLGHGLFETILVNCGSIPLLKLHWHRLLSSAQILDLKIKFSLQELTSMIQDLICLNQLENKKSGVRLTITDGISERGILSTTNQEITFTISSFPLAETIIPSMSATIVNTRRNESSLSSKVKSISYLDNILAKKEAVAKGFDEAFLLNSKSELAEGAISNIFIVNERRIFTPFIDDGALPGVIRHIILNQLILNNLVIIEKNITKEMLLTADEIFISNALLGVKPIHKIDNRDMPTEFSISALISKQLKEQFNYI